MDLSAVPANMTGVGRYGVEMLGELLPLAPDVGIEIWAITRKGDGERFGSRIPVLRTEEVVPASRPARLIFEQVAMRRVLASMASQLHHGIHYTLPRQLACKSVVTVHDATLLEHPEWHQRSKVVFFRHMISHAAKVADGLIFPSQAALAGFSRHFVTSAQLRVIPHGVSGARFAAPLGTSDAEIRERLGVSGSYFVFCGTLEPRKNLARVLEAFATLKYSEVTLVLAGMAGWGNAEIRTLLENLTSAGRVKVLGFVSDAQLGALYRGAVAALYPSLEEGFGLPGLEAMSQGSLLITSKDSAMAEYADGNALLVDPLDVAAIAHAMSRALGGGADLQSMSRSGRVASESFTWLRSAQGHLELYRSILGI